MCRYLRRATQLWDTPTDFARDVVHLTYGAVIGAAFFSAISAIGGSFMIIESLKRKL